MGVCWQKGRCFIIAARIEHVSIPATYKFKSGLLMGSFIAHFTSAASGGIISLWRTRTFILVGIASVVSAERFSIVSIERVQHEKECRPPLDSQNFNLREGRINGHALQRKRHTGDVESVIGTGNSVSTEKAKEVRASPFRPDDGESVPSSQFQKSERPWQP